MRSGRGIIKPYLDVDEIEHYQAAKLAGECPAVARFQHKRSLTARAQQITLLIPQALLCRSGLLQIVEVVAACTRPGSTATPHPDRCFSAYAALPDVNSPLAICGLS